MMRSRILSLLLVGAALLLCGASKEAQLANALIPRQVRVSFAAEQLFVSVRSRLAPIALGERSWARFDRDGSGDLDATELRPLLAEVRALETGHLGITVDGEVVPTPSLELKREAPAALPVPLDAELLLRFEGKHRLGLGAGRHRFSVYDQPRGRDGVVPFRIAFARGLTVIQGAGARGEIRGGGKRLEVATTKLSPFFWGVFERIDESAPSPSPTPDPSAPGSPAGSSPR